MPFNGNGVFVRIYSWVTDFLNGIDITASRMDQEDNGFATGLSNCVTRDGQGMMQADFLPSSPSTYQLGSAASPWLTLNGIPLPVGPTSILARYPTTAAETAAAVTPTNFAYTPDPQIDMRRYGADLTGATDSTAAVQAALNVLSAAHGGILRWAGTLLINSNLTIPDNCFLEGYELNPGQVLNGNYLPTNAASTLIINPSVTITHGSRCGVMNCMILSKVVSPLGAFPLPFANASVATNALAAFAGTAFTAPATSYDFRLENVLVLGFGKIYDGSAAAGGVSCRPLFRRVYGDCTNGIFVSAVADIGRAEDCHMWPFTTTNQSYTTNALLCRTGVAFYCDNNSTWFTYYDCFEFGWAVGFNINGPDNVRLINPGCDCPANGQPGGGCTGIFIQGNTLTCSIIKPTLAAQGSAGLSVVANGVTDLKVIGGECLGNNAVNGYISIAAGSCSFTDVAFTDNGAVGQVILQTGCGQTRFTGCTFRNTVGLPPIAIAAGVPAPLILQEIYEGTTTKQALPTWTPALAFGGGTTGITYSAQAGSYQVIGRLCICNFSFTLSSKGSSTGAATITGLPFTALAAVNFGDGAVIDYNAAVGLTGAPILQVPGGGTTINIKQTSATVTSNLADTNFSNTTEISGQVAFFIA